MTQPAVSKRIAQLEHRLAKNLFDRVGHQVTLTKAGQRLVTHVQTIIKVDLDLRFMDSEDALAAVEKGDIELAIITLPLKLPDHLQAITLWRDPMYIFCTSQYP